MGKKASKKIVQRFEKQSRIKTHAGNTKNVQKNAKKSEAKVETLIARQNQAIKKRSRDNNAPLKKEQVKKRRPQLFDVEAGSAKNQHDKKKANGNVGKDSLVDSVASTLNGDGGDSDKQSDEDQLSSSSDVDKVDIESKSGTRGDEDDDSQSSSSEDDAEQHRRELQELEKNDPEFYTHLKSEAKELLDFHDSDKDEESSENSDDDEPPLDSNSKADRKKLESRKLLDERSLLKLGKEAFEKKNYKAIKLLVSMFGHAIRTSRSEESDEKTETRPRAEAKYTIESESVKESLIRLVVSKLWKVLDEKLKGNAKESDRKGMPSKNPQWGKFERLIRAFLTDFLHALQQTKDHAGMTFLLHRLSPYVRYISCFHASKIPSNYAKFLLSCWGGTTSTEGERFLSFVCLEKIAYETKSMLPYVLKSAYLEFVRGAQTSSVREQERIAFQAKCLVQLFGHNLRISYELAFVYIRQLALHLRAAILSKSSESLNNVYSWQFIRCLKLWAAVLSAYPGKPSCDMIEVKGETKVCADDQQLRSLIYPCTQVIIGTMRLSSVPRFYPLQFQLIATLNSLAHASKYFIPITPNLLEIMSNSIFSGFMPKDSVVKPPSMDNTIRLNKAALASGPVRNAMITRALDLLQDNMECYRFSIGFPELSFPVVLGLRAFAKKVRVPAWRDQTRKLLSKVEEWVKCDKLKRSKVNFTPANIPELHSFMEEERVEAEKMRFAEYTDKLSKNMDEIILGETDEKTLVESDDDIDSNHSEEEQEDSEEESLVSSSSEGSKSKNQSFGDDQVQPMEFLSDDNDSD